MATISYALDIGVYFTGKREQVLSKTSAAWCRVHDGVSDLTALQYSACGNGYDEGVLSVSDDEASFKCGRSLRVLAAALAEDLDAGHRVGLGFEAPMWIPLTSAHGPDLSLFEARFDAEEDHRWYVQAGAAASLKAMVLGDLLFRLLGSHLGGKVGLTTSLKGWEQGTIVLYEAFVAGSHKVTGAPAAEEAPDEWDAFVAALAWGHFHSDFELPNGYRAVRLHEAGDRDPREVLSIWSTLRRAGTVAGPPDCEVVALKADGGGEG